MIIIKEQKHQRGRKSNVQKVCIASYTSGSAFLYSPSTVFLNFLRIPFISSFCYNFNLRYDNNLFLCYWSFPSNIFLLSQHYFTSPSIFFSIVFSLYHHYHYHFCSHCCFLLQGYLVFFFPPLFFFHLIIIIIFALIIILFCLHQVSLIFLFPPFSFSLLSSPQLFKSWAVFFPLRFLPFLFIVSIFIRLHSALLHIVY